MAFKAGSDERVKWMQITQTNQVNYSYAKFHQLEIFLTAAIYAIYLPILACSM